ncbi:MAG TPA: hypothetical protein VKV21_06315 [Solirubrobacteraceae bacterium]|nr:hypothetical protein [Solirubrobacteraceae bacterium]
MFSASTAHAPAVAAPSTVDASAPPAAQTPLSSPERPAPRPTPGRLYAGLAALTLALGALSLLAPSTPSYDPWSWTLWAREIVHGHLVITTTGTSWKPLPMLFTIPFALFGPRVAPDLWLVVARAGAIGAVLMAFRVAYRLVADVAAARLGHAARAPAALAGLLALVALGFAARGAYITDNGLGYSEALAACLLLVAVDCLLDGRHRAAFLAGFLVALDRPEIWLVWVPYGLWLARRERSMRPLVAACLAAQPVAWFLPVYLGSGHLGSSVARATHPRANSLAYASDPFWAELTRAALPTVMLRVKLMAALLVAAVVAKRWLRRPSRAADPAGRASSGPALTTAAIIGLGGLAWFVVIALMTQIGFSGNNRYLVLGAALVDVCGAVGFGWLAVELGVVGARIARATRVRRAGTTGRGRGPARTVGRAALAGSAAAAAAFALLPAWIQGSDFVALPKVHRALLYQAKLREDLGQAIALVGGRRRLLSCGSVMVEGFQVPMVAYALDVPTTRVLAPPASPLRPGPEPDTILQTRATQSSRLLPRVRDWNPADYTYRGSAGPWNTFTRRCASGT